ncbi:MAG: hypothetical protein LBG13_02885, partial [Holosporales bacterium]|nr:hypothetical protein [Holosporales bacterium]
QSNANQSAINFTPAGLGNQGVCDFAGAGTSTSTDTSTNTKNKSHKSDESVEREISKKISEKIEVVFSNHNTDIVFDIQKLSKTKAGTVFDIQELSKTKAGTMFDIQKLPPAPAEPSFQESNVKKSNIVQEMFRVWKSEFPGSEERLNLKISRWMKAAFDTKFQGNLQNWVDYLRLAKTSRFITENPHLLCLKWLLSFNAIEGICKRRAYGVAAAEPPPGAEGTESKAQTQATAQEIAEQIKNLDECEICKAQRLKILDRIGPCAYLSWFGKVSMKVVDIEIKCFDGGDGAASQFVLDRIAIHYRDLLRLDSEPNPETCPETCPEACPETC